jgi:hypothetical protein
VFWRPQPGRHPGVNLDRCLAIVRVEKQRVALFAWRQQLGALARLIRRVGEPLFEGWFRSCLHNPSLGWRLEGTPISNSVAHGRLFMHHSGDHAARSSVPSISEGRDNNPSDGNLRAIDKAGICL